MSVPAPLPLPGGWASAAAAAARLPSFNGLLLGDMLAAQAATRAESGVPQVAGDTRSLGVTAPLVSWPELAPLRPMAWGSETAGEMEREPAPLAGPELEPLALALGAQAKAERPTGVGGEPTSGAGAAAAAAAALGAPASSVCTVRRKWPWRQAAWKIWVALACAHTRPVAHSEPMMVLYTTLSGRQLCAFICSNAVSARRHRPAGRRGERTGWGGSSSRGADSYGFSSSASDLASSARRRECCLGPTSHHQQPAQGPSGQHTLRLGTSTRLPSLTRAVVGGDEAGEGDGVGLAPAVLHLLKQLLRLLPLRACKEGGRCGAAASSGQ